MVDSGFQSYSIARAVFRATSIPCSLATTCSDMSIPAETPAEVTMGPISRPVHRRRPRSLDSLRGTGRSLPSGWSRGDDRARRFVRGEPRRCRQWSPALGWRRAGQSSRDDRIVHLLAGAVAARKHDQIERGMIGEGPMGRHQQPAAAGDGADFFGHGPDVEQAGVVAAIQPATEKTSNGPQKSSTSTSSKIRMPTDCRVDAVLVIGSSLCVEFTTMDPAFGRVVPIVSGLYPEALRTAAASLIRKKPTERNDVNHEQK